MVTFFLHGEELLSNFKDLVISGGDLSARLTSTLLFAAPILGVGEGSKLRCSFRCSSDLDLDVQLTRTTEKPRYMQRATLEAFCLLSDTLLRGFHNVVTRHKETSALGTHDKVHSIARDAVHQLCTHPRPTSSSFREFLGVKFKSDNLRLASSHSGRYHHCAAFCVFQCHTQTRAKFADTRVGAATKLGAMFGLQPKGKFWSIIRFGPQCG